MKFLKFFISFFIFFLYSRISSGADQFYSTRQQAPHSGMPRAIYPPHLQRAPQELYPAAYHLAGQSYAIPPYGMPQPLVQAVMPGTFYPVQQYHIQQSFTHSHPQKNAFEYPINHQFPDVNETATSSAHYDDSGLVEDPVHPLFIVAVSDKFGSQRTILGCDTTDASQFFISYYAAQQQQDFFDHHTSRSNTAIHEAIIRGRPDIALLIINALPQGALGNLCQKINTRENSILFEALIFLDRSIRTKLLIPRAVLENCILCIHAVIGHSNLLYTKNIPGESAISLSSYFCKIENHPTLTRLSIETERYFQEIKNFFTHTQTLSARNPSQNTSLQPKFEQIHVAQDPDFLALQQEVTHLKNLVSTLSNPTPQIDATLPRPQLVELIREKSTPTPARKEEEEEEEEEENPINSTFATEICHQPLPEFIFDTASCISTQEVVAEQITHSQPLEKKIIQNPNFDQSTVLTIPDHLEIRPIFNEKKTNSRPRPAKKISPHHRSRQEQNPQQQELPTQKPKASTWRPPTKNSGTSSESTTSSPVQQITPEPCLEVREESTISTVAIQIHEQPFLVVQQMAPKENLVASITESLTTLSIPQQLASNPVLAEKESRKQREAREKEEKKAKELVQARELLAQEEAEKNRKKHQRETMKALKAMEAFDDATSIATHKERNRKGKELEYDFQEEPPDHKEIKPDTTTIKSKSSSSAAAGRQKIDAIALLSKAMAEKSIEKFNEIVSLYKKSIEDRLENDSVFNGVCKNFLQACLNEQQEHLDRNVMLTFYRYFMGLIASDLINTSTKLGEKLGKAITKLETIKPPMELASQKSTPAKDTLLTESAASAPLQENKSLNLSISTSSTASPLRSPFFSKDILIVQLMGCAEDRNKGELIIKALPKVNVTATMYCKGSQKEIPLFSFLISRQDLCIPDRIHLAACVINHPSFDPNFSNDEKNTALHTTVMRSLDEPEFCELIPLILNHKDINVDLKNSPQIGIAQTALEIALFLTEFNYTVLRTLVNHPKMAPLVTQLYREYALIVAKKNTLAPALCSFLLEAPAAGHDHFIRCLMGQPLTFSHGSIKGSLKDFSSMLLNFVQKAQEISTIAAQLIQADIPYSVIGGMVLNGILSFKDFHPANIDLLIDAHDRADKKQQEHIARLLRLLVKNLTLQFLATIPFQTSHEELILKLKAINYRFKAIPNENFDDWQTYTP